MEIIITALVSVLTTLVICYFIWQYIRVRKLKKQVEVNTHNIKINQNSITSVDTNLHDKVNELDMNFNLRIEEVIKEFGENFKEIHNKISEYDESIHRELDKRFDKVYKNLDELYQGKK